MPHGIATLLGSRGTRATPGYSVFIVPWAGVKSSVNIDTRSQASTRLGGGYWMQGATIAQNDEWTVDVWLDAGTYKVAIIHATAANNGIYTIQFNGVSQGTIDGYAAAGAENVYSEITGMAVTAGLKTLKVIMATKNASSTNYGHRVSSLALIRTGA